MRPVRITYDPETDILYLIFGEPTSATGYQLSDQLLLRIDPETQEAAGLTISNYSIHSSNEQTIPLPVLEDDPELKNRLMLVLTSPPLSHFLRVIEADHAIGAVLLSPSLREAVAV